MIVELYIRWSKTNLCATKSRDRQHLDISVFVLSKTQAPYSGLPIKFTGWEILPSRCYKTCTRITWDFNKEVSTPRYLFAETALGKNNLAGKNTETKQNVCRLWATISIDSFRFQENKCPITKQRNHITYIWNNDKSIILHMHSTSKRIFHLLKELPSELCKQNSNCYLQRKSIIFQKIFAVTNHAFQTIG